MNYFFKRTSLIVTSIFAIIVMLGCQNTPMEPVNSNSHMVKASQQLTLGLAKDTYETSGVIGPDGGKLGGANMAGNVLQIPKNALTENVDITFRAYQDANGVLVLEVERTGEPGSHIYLEPGYTAELSTLKSNLSEQPTDIVNEETGDKYEAIDDGDYWKSEVPHFSNWRWYFVE